MRLDAVGRENALNNSKTTSNLPKKSQNFKGIAELGINFWQMVDNGGRAAQFVTEDVTATVIPRSLKGAGAGKKYTGKTNYKAAIQEFLRELLTGPTMCIVPALLIAFCQISLGKTASVPKENIENLSYILSNTKNQKNFKDAFVKNCTKDMLEKTLEVDKSQVDHTLVDDLSTKISSYISNIGSKDKAKTKDLYNQVSSTFENIIKNNATNEVYNKSNFLNVNYSIDKTKTGSTTLKNYVENISDFIDDYMKKNTKNSTLDITENTIKKYKNTWIGRRVMLIAGILAATSVVVGYIPTLYTKVSGNVNPIAKAIYEEANKPSEADKKNGGDK